MSFDGGGGQKRGQKDKYSVYLSEQPKGKGNWTKGNQNERELEQKGTGPKRESDWKGNQTTKKGTRRLKRGPDQNGNRMKKGNRIQGKWTKKGTGPKGIGPKREPDPREPDPNCAWKLHNITYPLVLAILLLDEEDCKGTAATLVRPIASSVYQSSKVNCNSNLSKVSSTFMCR